MRIIGIDPGYERLGWGIIDAKNGTCSFIACGVIRTYKKDSHPQRLTELFTQLQEIYSTYSPHILAVETLFFSKNEKTALLVAQARGVIIVSGRLSGCQILEYAPSAIKSIVTGNGLSDKKGVEKMLRLQLPGVPAHVLDDTIDALAVAFSHGVSNPSLQ